MQQQSLSQQWSLSLRPGLSNPHATRSKRLATLPLCLALCLTPLLLGACATPGSDAIAAPQTSNIRSAMAYREWARRTREARDALQKQRYPEAQLHFVAALESLRSNRSGDVRYRSTMGHLVRLASIYGRLGREEEAERLMTRVARFASSIPETSQAAVTRAARSRAASETLRYDNLYQDWLSRTLEPAFRPSVSRNPAKRVPETPKDLDALIAKTALSYRLDPMLIKAVVAAESNFKTGAVSPAGAQGLMQLMPETSREMGVRSPFKAEDNLRGGAQYLRKMLDRFRDLEPALAAYNAGPAAVDRYGGIPPFPETKAYIERVLGFYHGYKTAAAQ